MRTHVNDYVVKVHYPARRKKGRGALIKTFGTRYDAVVFAKRVAGRSKRYHVGERLYTTGKMARRKRRRSFGALSIKTRCPPAGVAVTVNANPASRMLYSGGIPKNGTRGEVVAIPLGRGKATCLRGPGGGLIYVHFKDHGTMGVSSIDLDKAR